MTNSDDTKPNKTKSSPPKLQSNGKKTARTTNQESSTSEHNTPSKHRKLSATATTIVIALIAIGGASYAIYANMQLRQGMMQQANVLLTQMNTLKQQQTDTKVHVTTTERAINESQDQIQSKLNTLNKHLQSALQQRLYQSKDWLLIKARYYLELAQINAHWSDDTQTTSALLQQADTLLTDIHDQRLFIIRQTIAREIAQLKAMPKLDKAGLLSQLDAAQSIVASLPLKTSVVQVEKPNSTTTDHKSTSAWRERLKDSVGLLEKLVVVRHHNEDILPLPSPVYESMLREGIRLNIQEAQWAALQNNETVYQFSLAQAIKNVNRSFELSTATTKTLIKQLQGLQQIHILQQKPLLDQSLPLLNQLIESKDTQTPTTAGEPS